MPKDTAGNLIRQYWKGVGALVGAELDLLAVIKHHGERGRGAESVVRDLVRRHLPQRYRLSSGAVAYADGTFSKQCDLFIVDDLLSSRVYARDGFELVSPHSVVARIEVSRTRGAAAGLAKIKKDLANLTAFCAEYKAKTGDHERTMPTWAFTDVCNFKPSQKTDLREAFSAALKAARDHEVGPVGVCVPRVATAYLIGNGLPLAKPLPLTGHHPTPGKATCLVRTAAKDGAEAYATAVFVEALARSIQVHQKLQFPMDVVPESLFKIPTVTQTLSRTPIIEV
jgi:hypothetical protein